MPQTKIPTPPPATVPAASLLANDQSPVSSITPAMAPSTVQLTITLVITGWFRMVLTARAAILVLSADSDSILVTPRWKPYRMGPGLVACLPFPHGSGILRRPIFSS